MIKKIVTTITLLSMFFMIGLSLVSNNYIVESQVGPFNLMSKSLSEKQILSQYGEGYLETKKSKIKNLDIKRCYYIPEQNIWVEISFSHVLNENMERFMDAITITKQKLCDKKYQMKEKMIPLITSKGVQIGDSIENIIEKYGTPSVNININQNKFFSVLGENLNLKKGHIYRYLSNKPNDLLFAEFYFIDNRLHSLHISISE